MFKIKFMVDDAKLQQVIDTLMWLFPIPTNKNGESLFTEEQWVKESIRRWVVTQVHRKETYDAKELVTVDLDDTIIL